MKPRVSYIISVSMLVVFLTCLHVFASEDSSLTTKNVSSINYTLDELGLSAKTFSGTTKQQVNVSFYSPVTYPKSFLYPHLIVLQEGFVSIAINDAVIFYELLEEGEFFGNITIPTGLIKEGQNDLGFDFNARLSSGYPPEPLYYKITLLGDTAIKLEIGP